MWNFVLVKLIHKTTCVMMILIFICMILLNNLKFKDA